MGRLSLCRSLIAQVSGTELAYGATRCADMRGTEVAYGAKGGCYAMGGTEVRFWAGDRREPAQQKQPDCTPLCGT
eukprot:1165252-Rhodomonas_salina.2